MNIGDKIKENRLKKEWTQEQLLNVSRPTVSSWEVGRNYPDLETIIAISDLFGISLDKLLREDKEMAKQTTKKIKRGQVYKFALILIGVIFLLYIGLNMKLRFDERTYRNNLEDDGWTLLDSDGLEDNQNSYELHEDGITYWTYILPTGKISLALTEQTPAIVTDKDGFIVRMRSEDEIKVNISPDHDPAIRKQIYVQTNKNGELIENNENWSEEYKEKIVNYLSKYQDTHTELINKSLSKKQTLFNH